MDLLKLYIGIRLQTVKDAHYDPYAIRLKTIALWKVTITWYDSNKKRCWDIEAIFGNIKQNMGFKRFMLRGMEKVETEFGLIAMAHNLKKLSLMVYNLKTTS